MRKRWQIGVTVVIAVLVPTSIALGHGDVHERIAALTEEIEQQPGDAALYVRRGSLYALDESWAQALLDYESAGRVEPSAPNIDFLKAKVLVELEENERAVALLDSVLSQEPEHADGYLIRARAHVALGHIDEGTDDYTRAIALFERPAPRYYLERARALIDAGRVDEALAALREAVADLGPLPSLVELAVEEEEKRGHYEEALRWADLLSPTLRHSPRWRAIAGNLAHQLGQASRAEDEYRKALAAIDALPPARQGTEAMTALRTELTSRLETLAPSLSTEAASAYPTGLVGQGLALAILVALGILVVRVRK
ncbi:MAG: tetratricopeptide repeat protein [Myxococcales bacterium]|nr:tetratricopeptide repeat protein [Myxococcales bacterium]MDH3846044.1 tetratricopeptide repeat protein [Myxococcales bacterium]